MTRSELIRNLAQRFPHLYAGDAELVVKEILAALSSALASGNRIEIRGFGSFQLNYRQPRKGRNPATGDSVAVPGKFVPHFRPGKELREMVQQTVSPLSLELRKAA